MTAIPLYKMWTCIAVACALAVSPVRTGTIQSDSAAWMLFVDDLHVDFANTGYLRAFVHSVLLNVPSTGDSVAIRTSGWSAVIADLADRPRMTAKVRELQGGALRAGDPLDERTTEEMRVRARMSLSAAVAAVEALDKAESTRRTLIYVSNGPWQTPHDEMRLLADAVRRGRVTVVVINARSLDRRSNRSPSPDPAWAAHVTMSRDNLRAIAEATGGIVILDETDTPAALDSIRRGMGR